ncbi:unnamed protein product [Sphagnum jensenii]|uniref:BAH domain-containing protein n=1 Tax=Sphagnum jensenii TaxID=128206 RepID=A0ABP1AB87_9BRYO
MASSQSLKRFVDWEEQFVSHDRGSRVVHYYLKDRHGHSSLAVIGNERSLRHMVYVVCDDFLPHTGLDKSTTPAFKWRARREVVDWLQSLLFKTPQPPPLPPPPSCDPYRSSGTLAEHEVRKQVKGAKGDVMWVGNAWSCRKRLHHFHSFLRNGIKISIHNFVYVLTEEDRHIAYVEDMYEDKKMRKKLRVRWFHKTNELPCKIPPPAPLAREVFFTSFPQVLSVECVDGLATVLSPEHFEKCLSLLPAEAAPQLHVCSRQLDNSDGLKPFSIHEVKGYWHQQILSSVGLGLSPVVQSGDAADLPTGVSSPATCSNSEGAVACGDLLHGCSPADPRPSSTGRGGDKGEEGVSSIERHVFFEVGDRVEMLCQDSGLRGCWFKGVVTRRVSRRLKIQYEELQNEDGEGNLEEWISVWRLAGPDKLGVRIVDRTTVRPFPTPCTSADYYIGQAVDVWWNDGWWEGIVVSKEPEGNVKVYFPGEGDISSFHSADLRVSKDWVNGSWVDVHCNYEALNAASLSSLAKNYTEGKLKEKASSAAPQETGCELFPRKSSMPQEAPISDVSPNLDSVGILSNTGGSLVSSDLRWNSARKRMRHGGESLAVLRAEHRVNQFQANNLNPAKEVEDMQAGDGSMSDRENEGLTSPCDQEEPRWRTGERSGERDDTLKLKKLRQGHEGTLKPIHAPPVGGTHLFLGTAPIANLVMSR